MAFIKLIFALFIAPAVFMFLPGCSWIRQPSPEIPIDHPGIKEIIDRTFQYNDQVSTFISSGKVIFRNWAWGSEANTLIIGQKDPLRLKIELTHSWGRPILHLLISGERIEILSFSESRLYKGAYSPGTLSKFIQVHPEIDHLWPILRGYPVLKPYDRLISSGSDRIILVDRNGRELEKIGIDWGAFEISSMSFPGSDIKASFSEYMTEKDIPYAGKIRVDTQGSRKHLVLSHENMIFNREIPAAVFEMRIPPGFEIIDLDKVSSEIS